MDSVLGIDIAKRKFDVALWRAGKFKTKAFPNTAEGFEALHAWLAAHQAGAVHACLEATNTYGQALAEYLYDAGYTVSVVNPAQIKAFGESQLSRTKTDRADARLIAQFTVHLKPRAWAPLPRPARELRALVQRLEALQTMRQQERNRLNTAEPTVQPDIQTHIAELAKRVKELRRRLREHLNQNPTLRAQRDLLRSIPGIGETTLAAILARVPEPERFDSAKELAAFAGLSPRQRLSGSSVHGRTVLAKTGEASLRKALFMPTLVAMRYNPLIKAFYQRLRAAGNPPMSAVCAAMRKLIHLIYGVLKHRVPFNPHWALAN